jgi:hypothetical protein
MADSAVERTAAICERCGDVVVVRIGTDGEIRPIGSGTDECCSCSEPDLRAMDDAAEILDEPRSDDRSG